MWLAATRWSGPRLLLLLADALRKLVTNQVLGALEQVGLRLRHCQTADALELAQCLVLRRLQLLLELFDMHLAVVQALLAALDLGLLPLDLVLGGGDLLLDPGGRCPPVLHLALDLGAQLHRQLARLDLRLAPNRLRLPLGHVHARAAAHHQQPCRHGCADPEPNQRHDRSEHAVLPPEGEGGFRDERRGCSHPAAACTAALRSWRVRSRSSRRVLPNVRWIESWSD